MNAGKSTTLLQSAHNYRERDLHPLLFTPQLDTRAGEGRIASRIGLAAEAHAFTPADDLVPEIARGLRLVRIEYSIDDEVVARIPGDPTRAWRGERYPYRHAFKTRGEYEVTARAFILGPEAMPGDADGTDRRGDTR